MTECKEEKLTREEHQQYEARYREEFKRLYPDKIPEDAVLLNIHSRYLTRYNGNVTACIRLYRSDHALLFCMSDRNKDSMFIVDKVVRGSYQILWQTSCLRNSRTTTYSAAIRLCMTETAPISYSFQFP